jgi:hypothetical protein
MRDMFRLINTRLLQRKNPSFLKYIVESLLNSLRSSSHLADGSDPRISNRRFLTKMLCLNKLDNSGDPCSHLRVSDQMAPA